VEKRRMSCIIHKKDPQKEKNTILLELQVILWCMLQFFWNDTNELFVENSPFDGKKGHFVVFN
jgi:hypothetical protein